MSSSVYDGYYGFPSLSFVFLCVYYAYIFKYASYYTYAYKTQNTEQKLTLIKFNCCLQ